MRRRAVTETVGGGSDYRAEAMRHTLGMSPRNWQWRWGNTPSVPADSPRPVSMPPSTTRSQASPSPGDVSAESSASRVDPTRVGKPSPISPWSAGVPGRPHARGETCHRSRSCSNTGGRTPRAWEPSGTGHPTSGWRVATRCSGRLHVRDHVSTHVSRAGRDRLAKYLPLSVQFQPTRVRGERHAVGLCRAVASNPRACAGNARSIRSRATPSRGSSRLARGTRVAINTDHGVGRIIPAPAGNATITGIGGLLGTDHPRSRGERALSRISRGLSFSDHPRSRGERLVLRSRPRMRSGSSPLARGTRPMAARICWNNGSSPLARGTRRLPGQPSARCRIIPARAGNASLHAGSSRLTTDHPRSRGEHIGMQLLPQGFPGSSPLARGTRRTRDQQAAAGRIIPARAGNAASTSRSVSRSTDHPRSRGERTSRRHRRHGVARIIPARAGNAARPGACRPTRSDHPRSRGERSALNCVTDLQGGSSPLARGTPGRGFSTSGRGRIIPARAGNAP